jgi:hypothetical protein
VKQQIQEKKGDEAQDQSRHGRIDSMSAQTAKAIVGSSYGKRSAAETSAVVQKFASLPNRVRQANFRT